MKKFKTIGISFLVAACAVCLSLAFVACKGGEKSASYGTGEEGFYYYDASDSTRYMLSLQSGTYMITANGDTAYSGSYSYDEEKSEISFTGGEKFTAAVGENALSLDMGDSGYSFKAYKYFDVTYVDENGKTIATESVLNGQSAEDLDIEKDGYWFVGWFEDANNASEFAFNTSIAGNTTVYGWYIEKNLTATEYEITLDYGDGTTETVSTMNGAVWTLPTDGVLGWWVSATNKSGELTYKYNTGDVFTSDTTLYAVYDGIGASVTSAGIAWDASRAGANVAITITDENGETILTANPSSSSGSYTSTGFTSLATGTYTVTVGTDILTYVVNGLSRVSKSSMEIVSSGDGRVLSFAPVENASGYTITITDGTKTVTENLGSRTYYNFSGWEMTKEGLTFTVTAYADGYVSSVSDEYSYILVLDNVKVDIVDDVVTWSRVDGALEYEVIIYGKDNVVLDSFYTTDTSYSLKYYDAGTYTISVQPKTDGYYSEARKYEGYGKSTLAAPVITDVTSYSVSWREVTGAVSYEVMVGGTPYTVTGTETLIFSEIPTGLGTYEISVKAVDENGNDSPYSDAIYATEGEFSSAVRYEKNTVYWDYDIEASSYVISVNGVDITVGNGNSWEITLNKAGDNEIVVTAYDASGKSLGQASMAVYAYSVTLDPNGATFENGTATSSTIYVAQGDVLDLGEVVKDHADFVGWYTQADYTDGQSDVYDGKGTGVEDGSIFSGSRNLYLYAYWSYEYVTVTLNVGDGFLEDYTEQTISLKYYSTSYVLPVATSTKEENSFVGWYTMSGGDGVQYTSYDGICNGTPFEGDMVLYAYYLPIFAYSKTTYAGETVYSVSANTRVNTSLFTEIHIPETYDGCNLILNTNAFYNCSNLRVIDIPDTIRYISTVFNGYDSGSGAFSNCAALEEVNIYATGEGQDPTKEIQYYSADGVLYQKISDTAVELLYYPHGKKTDTVVIPSTVSNEYECDVFYNPITYSVTTIPMRIFDGATFSKIVFPSTITLVESYAFYWNDSLRSVVFEDGGTEDITISDYAFDYCYNLTDATLPDRYSNFDSDMFSGCSSLMNVYIDGDTYSSENGIVLSASGNTLVYYPIGRSGEINTSNLGLSSVITSIGAGAFSDNEKITKVTIADNVSYIGESAFSRCTGVSELIFEGDTNSIDLTIAYRAFYGCTLLTSVILPVNLTCIETCAFEGCSMLTYIYYDSRVGAQVGTGVGELNFADNVFGSQSRVRTLELGPNVPAFDFVSVFAGINLEEVIIAEANENYLSDSYGAVYDKLGEVIYFYPQGRLGDYTLLETTMTIGSYAFDSRVNLTGLYIGKNVTSIADDAFENCTYLTFFSVDKDNPYYGTEDGVLYAKENGSLVSLISCPGSNSVTSLVIPSTVTKVCDSAFESNRTVKYVSFEECPNITLGAYLFRNATALENVVLPTGLTTISERMFYGCTSLRGDLSLGGGMSIPDSVTTIETYAFYNCYDLAVTIPANVTSIGSYAFCYCWNDEDVSSAPIKFASYGVDNAPNLTIGTYAFRYTYYAASVTIPKNVVKIDNYAFQYVGYSMDGHDVTIEFEEGSGTELAMHVFSYAENTKRVELPEGMTTMNTWCFAYMTNLEEVVIPSTLETIPNYTFRYAENLKTVTFAENCVVTSIGQYAFGSNSSLESITIPASVTSFSNTYVFYECSSLETIMFEDGIGLTGITNYCFQNCTSLKEITIPATVTSIGNYSFDGCSSLETVIFADGSIISSIGNSAFSGCSSLTSFTFPETSSTISLGSTVFDGAASLAELYLSSGITSLGTSLGGLTSLTKITISENNSSYQADENGQIIYDMEKNTIAYVNGQIETVSFPGTLTTIGAYAFQNQSLLTEVTIPASVTSIGEGAFSGCTALETLTFAGDTSSGCSLGAGVFMNCKSLTEIKNLPAISKIPENAFYGCVSMSSFELSSGVSEIGASAFMWSGLKSIDFNSVNVVGDEAFGYCENLAEITFSHGIPQSFGEYVFEYCTSLKIETLPEGITTIAKGMFAGSGIEYFVVPSTVTEISNYAFEYCLSLNEVVLNDGLVSLGSYLFRGCESLTSCGNFPVLMDYGQQIFDGTAIKTFTFPEGMTQIPMYIFRNCSTLESIVIPDSAISIAYGAFYNCTNLKSVVMGTGLWNLDRYVFYNCSSLTSIELVGPNFTTIGIYNFYGCTSLESVTLGSSMQVLNDYSFYGCSSLKEINFENGLTTIGEYAFYGCTALENLVIPYTVTSVGTNAFGRCSCVIFADNTESYIGTYWESDWMGSSSSDIRLTVYYFSDIEPKVNDEGTAYVGNYWYYGENGEMVVWVL